MNRIDYRQLFALLPSPYMVLDHQLRYVDMNAAYLKAVGRSREEIIGQYVFDAFPDPGEGGRLVKASLLRVLETGQADSLPLVPYEIQAPASRGGQIEHRYWSAVHQPVLDEDGTVAFIVQNTVDVTELQQLKTIAYGPGEPPPGASDLLQRAQEVQQANASLLQETQDLRKLFMQAPGFMAVLHGPNHVFTLANNSYLRLVGNRPVIGRPLRKALPEVADQGFPELLARVMRDREPFVGQAMPILLQGEDGVLEQRYLDFIYQPILDASGVATAVFVEGSDVTLNVRAQEQQKLLLDELNHRVKNTLATVQAIASQTFRSKPDPAEFRAAFEARLHALSQTHNLITATSWRGASLREVLLAELRPHGETHYRVEGPDVDLSPAQALTLGLVFHELATNAAKYGALSAEEGCVRVEWSLGSPHCLDLVLTWRESGGPPVAEPSRRGFGSRLIERSVAGDLGGEARLTFAHGGLECRLTADLSRRGALEPVAAGL